MKKQQQYSMILRETYSNLITRPLSHPKDKAQACLWFIHVFALLSSDFSNRSNHVLCILLLQ
jgi:hypothetical protein